jgi:hypothetical protein
MQVQENKHHQNWIQVMSAFEVIYGSSEDQNQGVSQEGKSCFSSRHQGRSM